MVNVRPGGAALVGGGAGSDATVVAGDGFATLAGGGVATLLDGLVGAGAARGTREATTIAGKTVGAILAVVLGADDAGPTVGA